MCVQSFNFVKYYPIFRFKNRNIEKQKGKWDEMRAHGKFFYFYCINFYKKTFYSLSYLFNNNGQAVKKKNFVKITPTDK